MAGLFGTDGVRGVANRDLTPELAFALGRAAAVVLGGSGRPLIVVGRDTRPSGPMLQAALTAGVCSAGGDVLRLGVVPTPLVAFATPHVGARAGAVISASHNPVGDNGIKFFSAEGFKLPDDAEEEMEREVQSGGGPRPDGLDVGRIADDQGPVEAYVERLVAAAEGSLDGMRVVVDCANGAGYSLAPEVLHRLGADVHAINVGHDGVAINDTCGATHPEVVAAAVRQLGADAGVAHDGDADRAIFSDADGNVVDGDQVIAACALALKDEGRLKDDTVVVTVMSNLGLRRALQGAGITVLETKVGDRYVLEEMLRSGAILGGEQSGHVIFLDDATTGDGLLTAVRFLTLAVRLGASVAELASSMTRYPQVLETVPVSDPGALEGAEVVWEAVRSSEVALGDRGRILVRASGTESAVRVMVEAESEGEARRHLEAISSAVRASLAG